MNPRIRTMALRGNGGGAPIFNPSFTASYQDSPTVVTQSGQTPSVNTRATIATVTDWEGVTREVLSGENRFGGMRRVRNLLVATEALSGGSWTPNGSGIVTSGFSDPNGGTTAFRIVTSTSAVNSGINQASPNPGGARVDSIWLRGELGGEQVQFGDASARTTVTLTTSWRRYSGGSTFSSGFTVIYSNSLAQTWYAWKPQLESTVGQSNQNPSEYVSVGVLSSPFQGANVDGVQYYATQNGNTVASNVVTEATGALISSAIRGGFLPEPAATDLLTARADARDMTTANWTLGATMTRARTSVGADGVANKATRLTGGAVAATNIITTTITAAASSRTYSVLIKRVTGTGPVRITQDNFATSTDISGLINSSTYTLVQINQSQLNAQLGIKVDTNGDAIDADWNQFSAGNLTGLINSRIPDTITTRNADVLSYSTTGWLNANSGTLYGEFINPGTGLAGAAVCAALSDTTTSNYIAVYRNNPTTAGFDVVAATVTQSAPNGVATLVANGVSKICGVYQANDFNNFANNSASANDNTGSVPAGLTRLDIGFYPGGLVLGQYVRKVAYYPTRLPNSVAQALTV